MSLITELKRRNVFRAAAFYAASAWLLVQVATQVFPFFHVAEWVVRWIVIAAVIGFPFAMGLSWFYEWTPHGIQRESEVEQDESITRETAKKMDRWIIAIMALAIVLLLADIFVPHKNETAASSAQAPGKSIAVLPFENLSEDKANAYFASGIQDEILTRLAKIGALKVISRTSTQHYASSPDNLPQIARELGVANILEGSVQRAGDSVRVNVQLIRADGDSHLWAETYDRKLTDVFGVESEVAMAITDALQAKLSDGEQRELAVKPTDNPAAHDAYLQGLVLEAGGDNSNIHALANAFAEAVRLDPRFALAWAHLAMARSLIYADDPSLADNTPEMVKQAADTASRLQPDLGEAWLAQGYYRYRCLRDYAGALEAFDEARKRLPNAAQIFFAISLVERRQGRWDESLAHLRQAVQLDPRNLSLLWNLARNLLVWAQRPAEARQIADRALVVAPGSELFLAMKAQTYQEEGRLDEAARILDGLPANSRNEELFYTRLGQLYIQRQFDAALTLFQSFPPVPNPSPFHLADRAISEGRYQKFAGHAAAARPLFERGLRLLQSIPTTDAGVHNMNTPALMATAYFGLGDKQAALEQARKAVELVRDDALIRPGAEIQLAEIEAGFGDTDAAIAALPHLLAVPGGPSVIDLQIDPAWDPLRKDPRFQKLISDTEAVQAKTKR